MTKKLSVFMRGLIPVLASTAIALPSAAQNLTPASGGMRFTLQPYGGSATSIASAEPDLTHTLAVPIRQVSVDLTDGQLQLWIEGDRLGACNLPLQLIEQSEVLESLTVVRLRVFHPMPNNSDCVQNYVSFGIPFSVQQPIEPGRVYEVWVNDYHFTLENSSGNVDQNSI